MKTRIKLWLAGVILVAMSSSCAVQQSPAKERDSMKRNKEIQKDLRARYRVTK